MTEWTLKGPRKRPITAYLRGEVYGQYASLSAAGRKLNIHRSTISAQLKGITPLAGGMTFKYVAVEEATPEAFQNEGPSPSQGSWGLINGQGEYALSDQSSEYGPKEKAFTWRTMALADAEAIRDDKPVRIKR